MSERVYSLDDIRPDGWFEELADQSKEFKQLCQIVGDNVVACAMVAGVQITSLTVDPRFPSNATVGYQVGQFGPDKELSLAEFRRRVGATLLADRQRATALPKKPTPKQLQGFLGPRRLLLAAAFGLKPLELRIKGEAAMIWLEIGASRREVSVTDFYTLIDDRIQMETGANEGADTGIAIDLERLKEAQAASAQGDWTSTITLLSPWLGPISMLLRTGESEGLDELTHSALSTGLGLLGKAYSQIGNHELADEVLRLGVQWAGDAGESAELFLHLGESSASRGRFGEAIGFLRRALRLGISRKEALPALAQCFAARQQYAAAMVCAKRAVEAGATTGSVIGVRVACSAPLGDTWDRLLAHLHG